MAIVIKEENNRPRDSIGFPPLLYSAVNNRTNQVDFHIGKDEYICVYFRTDAENLTRGNLRVEIDGYGAPILVLVNLRPREWQANLRVPPGLDAGPHQVTIRTAESPPSNAYCITMRGPGEMPATSPWREPQSTAITEPAPVIYEVRNGMTESGVFYGHRNEYVCCRFRTVETALDRDGVILEIDGTEQPILFLTDLGEGCWQANARLPAVLTPGERPVRVKTLHSAFSNVAEVLFRPA